MGGIELLDAIGTAAPNALTVIMTGFGTVETAIDAMKRGAYDYILKPFKVEEVIRVVQRGLEKQRLAAENLRLREARLALQGERGHRGEPLARRGARDHRRHGAARARGRPRLHVARRRRGRATSSASASSRLAATIVAPASRGSSDPASPAPARRGGCAERRRASARVRSALAAGLRRALRRALDAPRAGRQGRALLRARRRDGSARVARRRCRCA